MLGTSPKDAIGINPKVAAQLSGADFDGDTVLVIPNSPKVGIKTSSPLQALKNFDPHEQYKGYEGIDVMKKGSIGRYMGDISNLMTDMTIKGANEAEIAKAVKHSMVVIDAHKHKLDFKQSYIDNDIAKLKERYQGASNAGASTLISKSKAEKRVPERVEGAYITDPVTGTKRRHYIDPKTGEKLYTPTGATYVDKKGRVVEKTTKTTNMAEVRDAHELSSGTRMEKIYADHANKLKALANKARKDTLSIEHIPYSPSAYKTYAPEVDSLNAKLNVALKNAPLERQAQAIANVVVRTKRKDNPDMSYAEVKKVKTQALIEARRRVGANKQQITDITPREWEAIQAGAISPTKLTSILQNSNPSYIKELAMPRPTNELTNTQISKVKRMLNSGYTQSEIADALGISTSTVSQISND